MFSSQQRYQHIQKLQNNPKNIRNISIVAHVDHGKTTLSDSLLSTNNIIHSKSVGKLRYLDSRKDEQIRGITMKSSSISLVYPHQGEEFLINLIDSPGHVEFSSEVSAALRITDGALILVDVIEGVSAQTYTVIRQCYQEKVRSILVLNKIDRLIVELQMTPDEAYVYLSQIIEQVNAILSKFIVLEKDQQMNKRKKFENLNQEQEFTIENEIFEEIESKLYFQPEKGNIVFASAIDCWSFTTNNFAEIFSQKLKCSKKVLQKVLYGDYYMNPKLRKISNKPFTSKQKPMFVDFILQNLWTVYERVQSQDVEMIQKLAKSLKIPEIPEKLLKGIKNDQNSVIKYIMNQWLPLEKTLMQTIIDYLPSPLDAQQERLDIISQNISNMEIDELQNIEQDPKKTEEILADYKIMREAIQKCDNSEDAPIVIFVSKMVYIARENINERNLKDINQTKQEPLKRFIGFCRIFSGRIKKGKQVYVIQQKKIDKKIRYDIEQIQLNDLYLMMASYLDGITEIGAGNILALGDLDQIVFKSATISSIKNCPQLLPINLGAKSILKVALQAKDFKNQSVLIQALKKLNKFDPSVEVSMQSNGDIILATCGQVHLERCVTDLEEMTEIEIKTSEPIVSFKETVVYNKLIQTRNVNRKNKGNKEYEEEDNEEDEEDLEVQKAKLIEQLRDMSDAEDEDINVDTLQGDELDIRYGLLDMQQQQELKEGKKYHNLYGQEKELKKLDHLNAGKSLANLSAINLLDLQKKPNVVIMSTPNQQIQLKIRCLGFNFNLAQWMDKDQERMRKLFADYSYNKEMINKFLKEFKEQVSEHIKEKKLQQLIFNNLVCFGPDKFGPNMLIYKQMDSSLSCLKQLENKVAEQEKKDEIQKQLEEQKVNGNSENQNQNLNMKQEYTSTEVLNKLYDKYNIRPEEIIGSVQQGFQMAVLSGPLCQEQMMGVCYILEEIKLIDEPEKKESKKESDTINDKKQSKQEEQNEQDQNENQEDKLQQEQNQESQQKNEEKEEKEKEKNETEIVENKEQKEKLDDENQQNNQITGYGKDCYGPVSGQIISTIKVMCWESFLGASPRVVEGLYLCSLQCDYETYPKVWDVLNRRRAIPINDDLQESSNMFIISAHLPIVESFNFYSEMQIKTSGRVNAQLIFDTWGILETDPFFVPQTLEELEEHGEKIQTPNFAKQLIEKVRKRKGIFFEQKIVESAEKQSNISKKR